MPNKFDAEQVLPEQTWCRTNFCRSNKDPIKFHDAEQFLPDQAGTEQIHEKQNGRTNSNLTRVRAILRSKAYVLEMFLTKTEKTYLLS